MQRGGREEGSPCFHGAGLKIRSVKRLCCKAYSALLSYSDSTLYVLDRGHLNMIMIIGVFVLNNSD